MTPRDPNFRHRRLAECLRSPSRNGIPGLCHERELFRLPSAQLSFVFSETSKVYIGPSLAFRRGSSNWNDQATGTMGQSQLAAKWFLDTSRHPFRIMLIRFKLGAALRLFHPRMVVALTFKNLFYHFKLSTVVVRN